MSNALICCAAPKSIGQIFDDFLALSELGADCTDMGHEQIVTVITPVTILVVVRKTRLCVVPKVAVFEILKLERTTSDTMDVFAAVSARTLSFRRIVFLLPVRIERFAGHVHAVVLLFAFMVSVQKTTCH